jgi:hypothetical protein
MFRHLDRHCDVSATPEVYGAGGRLRERLTVIAVRLEWFHVPPRKGGTFCFPGLVADAVRADARIATVPNLQ